MATANVIAETQRVLTAAVKAKSSDTLTPAQWAAKAGFEKSAASALREHIARASDNGCGRSGRYPAMQAEELLELIELGYTFKKSEGAKRTALQKRIASRVRPSVAKAAKKGAGQAGTQAKRSRAKAGEQDLEKALEASVKQVRGRKAKTAA